jgi:hypothetical protein
MIPAFFSAQFLHPIDVLARLTVLLIRHGAALHWAHRLFSNRLLQCLQLLAQGQRNLAGFRA